MKPYYAILESINNLSLPFKKSSDIELKQSFLSLQNESDFNLKIIQGFSIIREVCERILGMRPYDVQIIGAIALMEGNLAEMKTGEGKTLTAVLPACLEALNKKGVHILTFNDYLARRDANWMRPIYEFFDFKVSFIQEKMSPDEKKEAYLCDIVYATAKEVGFDFLRSFIAYSKEEIVLQPFNFAIIDEADALLIDEARNPLVLAGNTLSTQINLKAISEVIKNFQRGIDFDVDDNSRNIFLSEKGIQIIEENFKVTNLFEARNRFFHSAINLTLQAHFLLRKDIDYIVKDDEIKLVDEFTGRIVKDRKWQHGLQMAVEAKEGVPMKDEGTVIGSIPLQYFLKQYPRFAGMTATAIDASDEFIDFFQLKIINVPPNKKSIRNDLPDEIYSHKEEKHKALLNEISTIHKSGRPILVGTLNIKESEELAEQLKNYGIETSVLNAKNDELEAEIISNAGALNAVTISTNMAGRGTDIKLGGKNELGYETVKELGGLYVIGTNKHESKRIDNQLKGRAGRQGDPGSSKFIVSLEDELMEKYSLLNLLPLKYREIKQKGVIQIPVIKNRLAQSQRILESQTYEIRRTLNEYTLLIEKQRTIFQNERQSILLNDSLFELHPNLKNIQSEKNKQTLLNYILNLYDKYWSYHIDYASELREGIHLLRLGGENPLRKFQKKVDIHFKKMNSELHKEISQITDKVAVDKLIIEKPSSTWTYLVNDSPFENQFAINLLASAFLGSSRPS